MAIMKWIFNQGVNTARMPLPAGTRNLAIYKHSPLQGEIHQLTFAPNATSASVAIGTGSIAQVRALAAEHYRYQNAD
jgi:hypothetical protein